jgi:phospholipase C
MLSRRKFLQIAAASTGLAITGADLLSQAVANASTTLWPNGSRGVKHVVILMMENRSFDHFLGWLPFADGRHDLTFVSSADGNTYPNYPLAPDFQGCGYSDPDHSWEGFLVQHNFGRNDGFLQRPTTPAGLPGVTLAAANTFPIGYYSNLDSRGHRKAVVDLPVIGALAEQYVTLDRYFCSFAGETFPNRFYQHAAQTDRDHNSEAPSTLPTIWDQLSPIPNSAGIPTGGYYYRDSPFLALWAEPAIEPGATFKYQASSTRSPTPTRPRRRCQRAPRLLRRARTARCPTSATSTRPSTTRPPEPPATITRWATSGSASASSPMRTTPWPTTATSTTRSSS